ncbi:exosome complex component RRP41 [Strigomonas culicis]|uniref:Exosome complex component RRP41 n=1 Tax=Strigomonas culicis TaxID=28005 RepID=S9UM18_9TRYP|nr:exosome complex component RRP41 [Strigomonas culicis]|eukprot:EPY31887.1 exosome complex component RRP41 [Strigomonas culicis]
MSRHVEYVSSAGLRKDGRRPPETRQVNIEFGTMAACDGSCTVTSRKSKVCATVLGPRETTNRQEAKYDQVAVTCEVAIAAFAGERRRAAQRQTIQSEEISSAVVQVVRSIVLLSQYPGSQIHISVEILQNDGSEKIAAINAACLALVDANVAMRDAVCCLNAASLDNHILIDLTADELRSQCSVLSVAFTGHNTDNIVLV